MTDTFSPAAAMLAATAFLGLLLWAMWLGIGITIHHTSTTTAIGDAGAGG